jgi:hypothetical protein
MPRARFHGRAPALLEEPDQQENDEDQGDNAATDVHTSSSFGCGVNEDEAREVTASLQLDHELCAWPFDLTLPGFADPVEGIRLNREAAPAGRRLPTSSS